MFFKIQESQENTILNGTKHILTEQCDGQLRITNWHNTVCVHNILLGEDIKISLYGVSKDVDVRLDRNSVMVEKTYISLANYEKVTIMNRSDSNVHYQWKNFATQDEEEQDKLRFDWFNFIFLFQIYTGPLIYL